MLAQHQQVQTWPGKETSSLPRSPRMDSSSPYCKWLSWGHSASSFTAWAAHTNHRWRLQISERCSLSNATDDNLCCRLLFGAAASTASAYLSWVYPWPFLACLWFLLPLGILSATVPEDSGVPLLLSRVANTFGAAILSCPGAITLVISPWLTSELVGVSVRKHRLMHTMRKGSNCSVSHGHK